MLERRIPQTMSFHLWSGENPMPLPEQIDQHPQHMTPQRVLSLLLAIVSSHPCAHGSCWITKQKRSHGSYQGPIEASTAPTHPPLKWDPDRWLGIWSPLLLLIYVITCIPPSWRTITLWRTFTSGGRKVTWLNVDFTQCTYTLSRWKPRWKKGEKMYGSNAKPIWSQPK